MGCPRSLDDGILRAYVDRELSSRQLDDVAHHLAECEECRSRFAVVEQAARLAGSKMSLVAPTERERPSDPAVARARVQRLAAEGPAPRSGAIGPIRSFLGRVSPRQGLAALVPLAVVASLIFTPIGSAAQDLISVFRVQKVTTITISPGSLQDLPSPDGLGKLVGPDEPRFDVTTLEAAAQSTNLTPSVPKHLPPGVAAESTVLQNHPMSFSYTYDAQKLADYWRKSGATGSPPPELAGLSVQIDVPSGIVQLYADPQLTEALTSEQKPTPAAVESAEKTGPFVVVAEGRSPTVQVPSGVDVGKLREELLKNGPIPPQIATQLEAIQDWQTTLPIPVMEGTSRQIEIDGTTGVVLHDPEDRNGAAVIWQRGGVLHLVVGNVSEAEVIATARSLGS